MATSQNKARLLRAFAEKGYSLAADTVYYEPGGSRYEQIEDSRGWVVVSRDPPLAAWLGYSVNEAVERVGQMPAFA